MPDSSSQQQPALKSTIPSPHYIVGIGASAGGLEALQELFDTVHENKQLSYIIVQHLSPDYKSLMPEILAKHTSLGISEAKDRMTIEPNHVYLIPSDKLLTIEHRQLILSEKKHPKEPNRAIDVFFRSLAKDQKEQAIAVILSGTGSDGTEGIEQVKKEGGFVIVQEPSSARFDGMPNSAIHSGHIDLVVPPELIYEEISSYIKDPHTSKTIANGFEEGDEETLSEIFGLLRNYTFIDFTQYKRPTLYRRITRRMQFNKIEKLDDYLRHLYQHPQEVDFLGKEFLIGVTKFFRDKEAFEAISSRIIPQIVNRKINSGEPVKIWVAGCSTGEEAYTIAILLKEYFREIEKRHEVKIFATDVDREAIEFASKGIYGSSIEKDVPPALLEKYFISENGKYQIIPEIRKTVIFAVHNLVKDPPFSRIDLVSCRNLLIYLNPILQYKALSSMHFSLVSEGFLFLGPSENLGDMTSSFAEVDKKLKIYTNIGKGKINYKESFITPDLRPNITSFNSGYNTIARHSKDVHAEILFDIASRALGFAGIYINEAFEIVEARGEIRKFLTMPDKKLDLNILKMVDTNTSYFLSPSLRKALKNNETVSLRHVRMTVEKHSSYVDIFIHPLLSSNHFKQPCLLILFSENRPSSAHATDDTYSGKEAENEVTTENTWALEKELKETRENLQSAIEEIETSNEELQSSNEELMSANEELQSTNEELQSLNEELHTVNTEHQMKIKELIELNDDLNNYFLSSEIGQIFIDKDLKIRKFTPIISEQINIIENDIGRPIHHLSNNFRYENLTDDIKKVMSDNLLLSKEVEMINGNFFQMKILPFVRHDKSIDGVVITFVDITSLKNINYLLSGVLNTSLAGIMSFKSVRDASRKIIDFEWTLVNPTAETIMRQNAATLIGQRLKERMRLKDKEDTFHKYIEVVNTGNPSHFEYYTLVEDQYLCLDTVAVRTGDGFTITFADITDKKKAEEEVKATYEKLKQAKENLRKLNEQLELKVEERTLALKRANEDLEAAGKKLEQINHELNVKNRQLTHINIDLDNFVYTASHDLKAPISNIEALIMEIENEVGASNETVSELLQLIKESIDRFKNTILDLTEISKIQKTSGEDIETINVKQALNDIQFSIKEMLDKNKAVITLEEDREAVIQFSRKNFRSILYNLVSNAVKYRAQERTPEVRIVTEKQDGHVVLKVRDNGLGIPENKKNQIFTMFKRLHDHVDGTGVGLYIVKRIIENEGGKIEVDSRVGQGSEFKVYFRSAEAPKNHSDL